MAETKLTKAGERTQPTARYNYGKRLQSAAEKIALNEALQSERNGK